jgi:hypothetical protein
MRVNEPMQAFRPDEKIPASHEPEPIPPRERKHVPAAQASPDPCQSLDPLSGWHSGIIGAIYCTNTRAHHHIGFKATAHERSQHPDLNGAEAAPTGKDEGRFWSHGQRLHGFCYHSVLKGEGLPTEA